MPRNMNIRFVIFSFTVAIHSLVLTGQTVKPRVFVTDSEMKISEMLAGTGGQLSVSSINPERAKTLSKACPDIIVSSSVSRSEYIIVWHNKSTENTKWGQHENEYAVYNRDGDLIGSGGTHLMGSVGKDVCKIVHDAESVRK